jgi:hypothetical protein
MSSYIPYIPEYGPSVLPLVLITSRILSPYFQLENLKGKYSLSDMFLFLIFAVGWEWVPWYPGWKMARRTSHKWQMIEWSIGGTITVSENRSTRRKTCSGITLPATNFIWTTLGMNLDIHGDKPAINRLSFSTAWVVGIEKRITLRLIV